jgi:hypothetical protein
MKFELEEKEINRIVSALATQDPLIHKLSAQAVSQRMEGIKEAMHAQEQEQREREHKEAAPRGLSAQAGDRDWPFGSKANGPAQ